MKKNIVKMILVMLIGTMLSSCTLTLSAVTPTQKYNANITIIPVEPHEK